eukprot:gene431-27584_t
MSLHFLQQAAFSITRRVPVATQACASFVVGQRAMSGNKRTGRLGNTGGLPPPVDVGLRLNFTGRFAKADVDVPDGSLVVSATTREWYLESKLYSQCDQTASRVLGETMAQRLLESGITSVYWDIGTKKYHGRVKKFIDAVVDGGISLKETKAFKFPRSREA